MDESIISKYLRYTDNQESPTAFHTWIAISIIGASVARNVWFDQAYYKVYPNLYTILTAGSGECRKSVALEIGVRLLKDALEPIPNRLVISGKMSPEKLIQLLADGLVVQEKLSSDDKEAGVVFKDGQKKIISRPCVMYSDELGVFLSKGAQNSGMVDILTTLYSCPSSFEYFTKTAGDDLIHDTFLTIMGATTPMWIQNNVTPQVFGEGFAGRVLFVYADKPKKKIALPTISKKEIELREEIVRDLRALTFEHGEFELTHDGRAYYENWYNNRDKGGESARVSGFIEREPVHVLKVAMILALSNGEGLHLTERNIDSAAALIREVRELLPFALSGADVDPVMKDAARVLNYLTRRKLPALRAEIMHACWRYMGTENLDQALKTLVEAGQIGLEQTAHKDNMIYFVRKGREYDE